MAIEQSTNQTFKPGDNPPGKQAAVPSQEQGLAQTAEPREESAIYQKNRVVARVIEPEINLEAKEIHFVEIHNSENLLLPDECEFRQHRIMVKKIGYATKVERHSLEKGRILQDVKAVILGDRQS